MNTVNAQGQADGDTDGEIDTLIPDSANKAMQDIGQVAFLLTQHPYTGQLCSEQQPVELPL